jgi:hypothetical protein
MMRVSSDAFENDRKRAATRSGCAVLNPLLQMPCPIRVIAAGQIADAESVLAEEPACIVGPLPDPAVDPDLAIVRQFIHPVP